jgi:hypothetical protein
MLNDSALDEHLRGSITLAHHSLLVHFRLHFAIAHDLRSFTSTCGDLLGWDDERSLSMLTGTSTSSTEAGRALADLSRVAGRSAQVRRLLASAPSHEVLAADPEFAAAFDDYVERFCFRALTYDVRDPTLAERPELVLNLVRDQLADDRPSVAPGDGAPLIAEARARLATAAGQDQARFEHTLSRALRAYPVSRTTCTRPSARRSRLSGPRAWKSGADWPTAGRSTPSTTSSTCSSTRRGRHCSMARTSENSWQTAGMRGNARSPTPGHRHSGRRCLLDRRSAAFRRRPEH